MQKMFFFCDFVQTVNTNLSKPFSLNAYINIKYEYTVSVLGREEGYTFKYTPSSEGVPEGEARGNSFGLMVYPQSSPNTDSISFKQSICS